MICWGFFYSVLFLFPLYCIKIALCAFFSLHFSFSVSNKWTSIYLCYRLELWNKSAGFVVWHRESRERRNLLLFLKHLPWEAREVFLPFYVENVNWLYKESTIPNKQRGIDKFIVLSVHKPLKRWHFIQYFLFSDGSGSQLARLTTPSFQQTALTSNWSLKTLTQCLTSRTVQV